MRKYVIVLWNSDRKVAVIGSKVARTFSTEAAAQRVANRYEKLHPTQHAIVCELEPWDQAS